MSKHSKKSRRGYIAYGAFGNGNLIDTKPVTQIKGEKVERKESKIIKKVGLWQKFITTCNRICASWKNYCLHWTKTKISKTKESV